MRQQNKNEAGGSMLERSQGGEMWGFLIRERGMRDHSLFLSLVITCPAGGVLVQIECLDARPR